MKRSNVGIQTDLFSNVPTPPAILNSHPHHDEIVELLAKLLWEVAQMPLDPSQSDGGNHD